MKLFGWRIERAEQAAQAAAPATVKRQVSGLTFPEELTSGGRPTNVYQQSAWVYRAVNILAEQVANMPFRFSAKAEPEKLIETGPLVAFYNEPHPALNRFQYWELRVMWLLLRGECFRVPVFGRDNRLEKVLMLDPADFEHIVQEGKLIGWRYRGGMKSPLSAQVFLPEEVWFDRLPNPYDTWRGLGPLSVALGAAETDYAGGQLMRGLFENNGEPGMIVRTEEQLDPEQREQLLQACAERRRGGGRTNRPLLLWGGAEVVTPTLSGVDEKFLSARRASVAEICAAFGVPEEMVTSTANAKYDIMAGTRLNFIENRVIPLCRRLEAEEARVVRLMDPKACGWFDVEGHPVITQARRERLAAARAGFEMGVPFNELNRTLSLGFSPLPWGDQGYVPKNMVAVSKANVG